MCDFIVTYGLNGQTPSHKQVDDLLSRLGAKRARFPETVCWVDYSGSSEQLCDHLLTIIRHADSILVCECPLRHGQTFLWTVIL